MHFSREEILEMVDYLVRKFRLQILKREFRRKGVNLYGDGSNLNIDDTVSFGGNVILYGTADISIGPHTIIGLNSILHTSTHRFDTPLYNECRIDRPIHIGKNVWIGANVTILAGVVVEDNAIICAGSVVTKNVRKNHVVAGVPAALIRTLSRSNLASYKEIQLKSYLDKWVC